VVTESDRDTALETLLVEQVETAASTRSTGDRRSTPQTVHGLREGRRIGVVTGSVLVVVVAITVLVLSFARPTSSPSPAQSPTGSMPAVGQVLAVFTSANGHTQTQKIATNGTALRIEYRCTGSGQMAITVPHGPSLSADQCDGPTSVSSPTGLVGPVPITVAASGSATWTVIVIAIKPNRAR
jgi:hypothetical protein